MTGKKRSRVPARPCVFCGSTAGITDEHVWPKWLRAHAADLAPERYTHTSGFARTAADAFTEAPTVLVRQPGTILGLRARAVCRECNGGWMSGLEQRAKPILLNMMSAARPGSVLTLGPDQAATVAAWAIKTAWMREETAPGDRATTRQMRRALHRDVLWTCLTFRGISLLAYTVDGWARAAPRPVPVGPPMAVRLGCHRRQRPGCPDGRRAAAEPEVSPGCPVRA